ncbi:proline--tRNA ligase [Alkalihalobacterium chitinilyticum]|uniref:Proline--tRNA ligase n=1 Tax=Alkalihalobacterium chitinilyticum TaxID=2980103 RepID=A0ABT5VBU7_9BACI|nr:proline--tRNA ligase [Alkalihalobacterium chitinilyticum]MDE5412930.1 proline--tRNA ligase [Alkalihalobacterium chitinilyticum]
MKQSSYFIPTMRDVPADAEIASHQLMLRAGMIRQTASGIYSYLPLGKRVLKKVEEIIREEMDASGAIEVLMPAIQPAELWEESGRLGDYGPELMRLKDRHDRDFVLGATHEEVITSLVRDDVKSYKKLPLNLYQIQTKYRDERRPRFGVLRSREFLMKDAYSFDTSKEGLDVSYEKMYNAYTRIFQRCGLEFRAVEADSGAIGGTDTHEFMVLTEVGEDTIAYSDQSEFAANIEIAPVQAEYTKSSEAAEVLTKVETPNVRTIEELVGFFNHPADLMIKAMLFLVNDEPVVVLVRGDHEVNEIKVKNLFDKGVVELAAPEQAKQLLNCETGYIGPIGLPANVKVVADLAVQYVVNGVCGANEPGYHFQNVNPERDFEVSTYADLRLIQEGDPSPDGKGTIQFAKGIEVGHVFKLGTKYSEALGASFLDDQGKSQPMIMGCYGIGVSRTVAAIVEQSNDENGLVWPTTVAPFDIHLIAINVKDEAQLNLADKLYDELRNSRYDVLYDERPERAGVKFKDADLIGLPIRIGVGKKASEGIVEVKLRKTGEMFEVSVEELNEKLNEIVSKL